MAIKLNVYNQSNQLRSGNASISWKEIQNIAALKPENLVVRSNTGQRLLCQLDPIDSTCPMYARLHFSLLDALPALSNTFVEVENVDNISNDFGKRDIILT